MRRRCALKLVLALCVLPACAGCSTLGFGSRPVAHVITNDAKDLLDQASNRPNVPTELSKNVVPRHTLQPGDSVLVEVLDENSKLRLPADQAVMPDGTIDLGRFGRLIVAAMTPEQAEATIQNVIAASGQPAAAINVRLIESSHRFYVVGEVNSPGSYPLVGNETVLDALMKAGGLTDDASACDILLARPTDPCSCRVALPVCYRAITQLGDTSTNYHLQPGDRLIVARQSKMEEILGFLSIPFSCPNCNGSVKACPDPGSVVNSGTEFVPTHATVLPAASPPAVNYPTRTSAPPTTSPTTQSGVRLLGPELGEDLPVPPNPGMSRGAIDGELDFGDQFLQPRISPR